MFRSQFMRLFFAVLMALFAPQLVAAQELPDSTQQAVQLDINSADAATIAAALEGVGMVKAEEIVAYREMFGNFSSIEELLEVKGIGAATVERNRHRILVINAP
jgi:competence protein ComEA